MNLSLPDRLFYFFSGIDPADYPELGLLASEDDRQRLIHGFCLKQKQNRRWYLFWIAFVVLLLGYGLFATRVWPFSLLPHWVLRTLFWFSIAFGGGVYLRIWGRREFPVFLRAALRRRGICVCMGCGYDLTANASGTCPECGQPAGEGPSSEDQTAAGENGSTPAAKDHPTIDEPFRASWGWVLGTLLIGPLLWGLLNADSPLDPYLRRGLLYLVIFVVAAFALIGIPVLTIWALRENRKLLPGRCGSCGRRLANPKAEICPKCHRPTRCCPACGYKALNKDDRQCRRCQGPIQTPAATELARLA